MDFIELLAQPSFLENGSPGFTIIEQSGEMIHILARFAGKLQHDFSPPNITTFSEESPADSKVKIMADHLALLKGTPRSFKRSLVE